MNSSRTSNNVNSNSDTKRNKSERKVHFFQNVSKEFESIVSECEEISSIKKKRHHKNVKSMDFNQDLIEKAKIDLEKDMINIDQPKSIRNMNDI